MWRPHESCEILVILISLLGGFSDMRGCYGSNRSAGSNLCMIKLKLARQAGSQPHNPPASLPCAMRATTKTCRIGERARNCRRRLLVQTFSLQRLLTVRRRRRRQRTCFPFGSRPCVNWSHRHGFNTALTQTLFNYYRDNNILQSNHI